MILTRSYLLAIYPTAVKADTARYTYERHLQYVNAWVGPLFFGGNKTISTEGLGTLAHRAQRKARGIIAALKASQAATGGKTNVPLVRRVGCPAQIQPTYNGTSFQFWIRVANQFTKTGGVSLPAKSHSALNEKLRSGWALNPVAELVKERNGKLYVRVFAQREAAKAIPKAECLGVDVGYRHGACRSDGYLGTNTGRVIKAAREKQAQRQRQGLKVSGAKSRMKQLLDREARVAVHVARDRGLNLAIEDPKRLANLRSGRLHGWARSYFGHRCETLCQEMGVWLVRVNPSFTSQTCAECLCKDALSRSKGLFVCTACSHRDHADVNAARVIARKGSVSVCKIVDAIRNRNGVSRACGRTSST